MCGGGPKGPSSEELIAQEQAAQARAKAEIDKMNAERELEKEAENAKMVAEQAAQANTDAARRASNRTLLAGLAAEEGEDELELEDPKSQSTAKRKRATLISTGGE
jgi:hypothetical protein